MLRLYRLLLATFVVAVGLCGLTLSSASGYAVETKRYVVVLDGDYAVENGYAVGSSYAVYAVTHQYAVYAVQASGGTIKKDLSREIGVLIAESPAADFAQLMKAYAFIKDVSQDVGLTSPDADGGSPRYGGGTGSPGVDPYEGEQWGMKTIRTRLAHQKHAGRRVVDVGILDTGIDGSHVDFQDDGQLGGASNVACHRGYNAVPKGYSLTGVPDPCVDNGIHGTHVAGIVAAQRNAVGVAGVAPKVTLVPVKVCDQNVCWAGAAVDGITYAAKAKLDVINMSFYADDVDLLAECKPEASANVTAINRAIAYARSQGVVPVAALGNSATDLGAKSGCDVVPAESPGVIGVSALGPRSELAAYSSFGLGATDVAAPGGNGTSGSAYTSVLSSVPGQGWQIFQGTSMAAPHAAGVAALIVSRYGYVGSDGDVKIAPHDVQRRLQATAIDLAPYGYDRYFGSGRVDALRAIGG